MGHISQILPHYVGLNWFILPLSTDVPKIIPQNMWAVQGNSFDDYNRNISVCRNVHRHNQLR